MNKAKTSNINKIHRIGGLVLALVLILSLLPMSVLAVTGSQVAADGVYTSTVTAYKYKYGKLDKTYTGTLNVAVSDGEIAGLWITNASSDKMSKLITNEIYYTYVGSEASANAVQSASGLDAVTSASVAGSSSAVDSSVKKQYVADIQGAIITALRGASAAPSSSSGTTATAIQTVQGTAGVSDSEGSKLVLDVGLDSNGKIVSLTVNDSSVSDWSSIVSKNAASYVGKTADEIDAVSGATPYTTAVNTAVLAAMEKADTTTGSGTDTSSGSDTGTGSGVPGTDSGKTISPDGSATITVGETVTLDGTHNSMASSESWSSSNPMVATVAASGGDYDSDATVTGVSAGTATVTHTINSLFGSSTETFAITVTGSGSGSDSGSGSGSSGTTPTTGVTAIQVTKEWKSDTEEDRPASVTVGIYDGSTKVQTLTLNAANGWTATATGLSASISYTVKEDAVDGYTSSVEQGETTGGSASGGWVAQSYGAVEAGKTYAFTYTSNGTTYLLGRSGTSVIGTTSGLSGGVPTAGIGNDYKWEISSASSRYGDWYLKNLGNNYYLAVGSNYSTGYQPGSYLNSSASSYYGAMHLDDDGSIWNGYSPGYNLYASGASVGADSNSFTVFTPYLYTEGGTATQTATYTITNTKVDAGSGGGSGSGGTGGGEEEEPDYPAHVKAISPDGKVAEEYTITLDVTAQSKTTTIPGSTTATNKVDVLFIADMSYSMYSTKSNMPDGYGNMRTLDEALRYILSSNSGNSGVIADILNSSEIDAQVALVSFSDIATPQTSWTKDLSTAYSAVWKMNAMWGGETNVSAGLEAGQALLSAGRSDAAKVVILLSDGDANRPADEATGKAQAIAAAQGMAGSVTKFYAIGFNNATSGFMQELATQFANYSWTDAGNMASVSSELNNMKGELSSLPIETAVPMSNVVISDTLSNYVEMVDSMTSPYGVTVQAGAEAFTDFTVMVNGKIVEVTLNGDLTDGTIYTVSIPVKPSEAAQAEANENDDAVSSFVSNAGATLTYQYGTTDEAKTVDYTELPKIYVARQVTLTYDDNVEDEEINVPAAEMKPFANADAETVSFDIFDSKPTRRGYTFLGWADSADAAEAQYTTEEGKNTVSIAKDTILYAVWAENPTVTFDVQGRGEKPADQNVAYNEHATKPADPTETGYTFGGWYTDSGCSEGNEYSFDTPVTKDITLYAMWTANGHTVTYTVTGDVPEGYTAPENTAYAFDADVTVATVPESQTGTKDGVPGTYSFEGWTEPVGVEVDEDGTFTMPDTDVEFTGSWTFTPSTYTVKWVDEDGTVLETDESVAYGTTPSYNGETPTKAGDAEHTYTFAGWSPEISAVTGDTTYTATYTASTNAYTVTWKNDDGTVLETDENVAYGETPTYHGETPTKAGDAEHTYTFAGWTPEVSAVTGDVTYTATYTASTNAYTITWKNDDGTVLETDENVAYGATPSYDSEIPTKAGDAEHTYTFAGWTPDISAVTGDVIYTATYTASPIETDPPAPTAVSYKVDTTTTGHTYEIYQIFTGDYADNEENKPILSNIVWGENGTGTTGDKVDEQVLNALNGVLNEELDKNKLAVIGLYVTLNNPIQTITVDGEGPANVQLPAGYYLIRDVPGTHSGENADNDAYTTYITVIVKDYTVTPKSVYPTVDKSVADNDADDTSDNSTVIAENNTDNWKESADHAINENFQFKLTATLPASTGYNRYNDYDSYVLKFTDTMSDGVSFDGIASVKIGSTDITAYTCTAEAGQAGGSWTLELTVPKVGVENPSYDYLASGATVTVVYNAHLNENAKVHTASVQETADTNKNTVYLEYSNNPNTDYEADRGKTAEDIVWVFTYESDNTKVDGSGNALPGAGFTLYSDSGKTTAIKLIDQGSGKYIVADQSAETGYMTEMISSADGTFKIVGLDAGTYYLSETTTPPGYNTCEDKTVTITAKHKEDDGTTKASIDLTGSTLSYEITNQSGSALPHTGGIGTKLFYMFGVILALGAGVLLVSRRRAEAA